MLTTVGTPASIAHGSVLRISWNHPNDSADQLHAYSRSPSQSGACEGGDQPNKGGDCGPSRENNSALADQNVGGDDSANANNSALTTATQLGLLQDRAPGDIQIPGNHASALRDCSMISAGP
jgi:hypothetical protein